MGKFGNVKPMLEEAFNENLFPDIDFVLEDGSLSGHRFVVGAQSRYLRNMFKESGDESGVVAVHLPEVKTEHMNIVLKFLYTGKFTLTKRFVPVVKELLESILFIDAKITLPDIKLPSDEGQNRGHKRGDDDDESGGSGNSRGGGDDTNESSPSPGPSSSKSEAPPKKRFRPNSDGRGQGHNHGHNHGVLDQAPLSPPHSLDEPIDGMTDFADEEEKVFVRELSPQQNTEESAHQDSIQDAEKDPKIQKKSSFRIADLCSGTELTTEKSPLKSIKTEHIENHEAVVETKESLRISEEKVFARELSPQQNQEESANPDSIQDAKKDPKIQKKSSFRIADLYSGKELTSDESPSKCIKTEHFEHHEAVVETVESLRISKQESPENAKSLGDIKQESIINVQSDVDAQIEHRFELIPKREPVESFTCEYCDKDYDNEQEMRDHIETHFEGQSSPENAADQDDVVVVGAQNGQSSVDPVPSTSGATPNPQFVAADDQDDDDDDWNADFNEEEYLPDLEILPEEEVEQYQLETRRKPRENVYADLPPPVPQPPESGMQIYRGDWVNSSKVNRIQNREPSALTRPGVRKYNYTPFVTISGKSKQSTVDLRQNEQSGAFHCPFEGCNAVFELQRSLDSHISRNHHQNLKARCPECNKALSTKAAIPKHLLSHRPRSEWPFRCPISACGRPFQAKGDVPKHLKTAIHKNDRIPKIGSPEWKELMDKSVVIPNLNRMMKRGKVAKANA